MRRDSQKKKILAYLEDGHKITPTIALSCFGCFRLAAVIYTLRKEGYTIKAILISVRTRDGSALVAEYSLDRE